MHGDSSRNDSLRQTPKSTAILLVALLGLLMQPNGLIAQDQEGYESLFDGKSLHGWKGNDKFWKVEEGAIVGQTTADNKTPRNTFLIWQGGDVGDFELHVKARVVGNNSGIQYRSKEKENFSVKGYQMDMHPRQDFFGMLYEEGGRGIMAKRGELVVWGGLGRKRVEGEVGDKAELKIDEWNEYSVIAEGHVLVHKVNGVVTMQLTDNQREKRSKKGIIALQLHAGAPMRVEFKDIRLKRLGDDAKNQPKPPVAVDGRPMPQWIWLTAKDPKTQQIGPVGGDVYLRKVIEVNEKFDYADISATADNNLDVYVNGTLVISKSNWNTVARNKITHLLKPGKNIIAAKASNKGPGAAILRVKTKRNDRRAELFVSDGSWKASKSAEAGWQKLKFDDSGWSDAAVIGELDAGPRKLSNEQIEQAPITPLAEATPISRINVLPGFKAELVYAVPNNAQGSWVSLTVDPKGRLIASDQGGKGIYRITPPPIGGDANQTFVEKLDLGLSGAQGLCFVGDDLYVVSGGLHRARDTDGDDQFDEVKVLRAYRGGGEHGPHAVIPGPNGQSLYVIGGNHTPLPNPEQSTVPRVWDEDHVIGRMWDARGHARGKLAPGGWICRTDLEGKEWTLVSNGYRNQYDIAFNKYGDLFTYDADMEWDIGTPWYRPTRVFHATSGSEAGWRSGTGKWPTYYPDSLPPVHNVGPGSPTGVVFGYGARFPKKYQEALFICDWSYGKIYAVHLVENGASYTAEIEQFVAGVPLPATDVIVNPRDGALYFAIGGRGAQSGLYRIVSEQDVTPSVAMNQTHGKNHPHSIRKWLETMHAPQEMSIIKTVWPYLQHEDRFVRYAARIAIEHQPVEQWAQRALESRSDLTIIESSIALARHGDKSHQTKMLKNLNDIRWGQLGETNRLAMLRAYGLAFTRMGQPEADIAEKTAKRLDDHYPSTSFNENRELVQLLVYLDSPGVVQKTLDLLDRAPSQEEQIFYALALRNHTSGWTRPDRERYFAWFNKVLAFKGGASFGGFVKNIKNEAIESLSEEEKQQLAEAIKDQPPGEINLPSAKGPGKEWTVDEIVSAVNNGGLRNRNFANGKDMFGAGTCFMCHRVRGEGGAIGPDLTSIGSRYDVKGMVTEIVHPSAIISDQYAQHDIELKNGKVITGRIINGGGGTWRVNENMLDSQSVTGIAARDIKDARLSEISPMLPNLLDSMNKQEVLDLIAYLRSGGDPDNEMFKK